MALPISRAGFHVIHHKHGTARSRRASRVRLAGEAMRAVDETKSAYWAAKRPSIIASETPKNIDMVNDGNGNFKVVTDIREVCDYGEARTARLKRKPRPDEVQFSTIVAWMPASLLEEIPDVYPVTDKDTGKQLYDADGNAVMRSRFVPRSEEEMVAYFESVLQYFESLLPDRAAAIHSFSINLDEHRPHIHITFDTFEQHPDDPTKLRTAHSKVWGQHRDVRWPEGHEKAGKTIMGRDKLSAMQANFKQMHHDLGIPIEFEPAPRAGRGDVLADFAAIEEERLRLKYETDEAENTLEIVQSMADTIEQGAMVQEKRRDERRREANLLEHDARQLTQQIEQQKQQVAQYEQKTDAARSKFATASHQLTEVQAALETATAQLEATQVENEAAKERRQTLDKASDALDRQAKRKMAEADEYIEAGIEARVEELKPELMEQLRQVALAGIADELEETEEKLKELKERERNARADFDRYTDQSIKASNSARDAQQRFAIIEAATVEEIQDALDSLDMANVAVEYIKFLGGSVDGLREYSRGKAVATYVSDQIAAQEAEKQRQSGGGGDPQPNGGGDGDRDAGE